MKIYISHLFEDEQMKRVLDHYPVGLETIEFGIGDSLDRLNESIDEYRTRMGTYLTGRPFSVHGPFLDLNPGSFDKRIRAVTMERFQASYQAARQLGAEKMIVHSCFIPTVHYLDCWVENSITFFHEFLDDKDERVKICLENVLDPGYGEIKAIIENVAHPGFLACLDVGHANAYSSQSVFEWLEGLKGKVGHVHLHNNNGQKDCHGALDDGQIPMEELLVEIDKNCPCADWTIENNTAEDVVRSLEALKRWGRWSYL